MRPGTPRSRRAIERLEAAGLAERRALERETETAVLPVRRPRRRGLRAWLSGRLGPHLALALSTADQALVSATSLGVALLFVRGAAKEEYGIYTLVNGLVLLGGGVQAALITTPLTANASRLAGVERARFLVAVGRLQRRLAGASALLLGGGITAWELATSRGARAALLLGGAASVAVLGCFAREFQRTNQFLDERPGRALLSDGVFASLAALGLAAIWRTTGTLNAPGVLALIGLAALAPSILFAAASSPAVDASDVSDDRPIRALLRSQGRWTLPGMAVTWGQNAGYAYVVGGVAGAAAVADVAAARLFIMPINLVVTAWQRIFLPRAGAALSSDRDGATVVLERAQRSAVGLGACAIAYLGGVAIVLSLPAVHLPARYGGLRPLVAAWGAFVIANTVRSVASSALLAHAAFRAVFVASVVGAALSLAAMAALVPAHGALGAVYGMLLGELTLAGITWKLLATRRAESPAGARDRVQKFQS